MLRLSFLRAATVPDAEQDQGMWFLYFHCMCRRDKYPLVYIQENTNSRGQSCRMWVPSWNPTCQEPPISSTLRFIVSKDDFQDRPRFTCPYLPTVRAIPPDVDPRPIVSSSPFSVDGSPNVFLETIKRGEDDDFGSKSANKTVILRLYEAYGGHGRVQLRVSPHIRVVSAELTNLLEDHKTALSFVPDSANEGDSATATSRLRVELDFRAFEVKTMKLVVESGNAATGAESDDGARCDVRVFLFGRY